MGYSVMRYHSMRRTGPRLSDKIEKSSAAEGVAEPGAGIGPFLAGEIHGDAQGGRHFLMTHGGELAELHNPRRDRVLDSQPIEGLVKGDEVLVGILGGQVHEVDSPQPAA